MPEFDVAALRARFPALAIEQDGRPVALFDGPGGTQVTDIGHRGRQPLLPRVEREPRRHVPHLAAGAMRSSRTRTPRSPTCSTRPTPSEVKFGANMTTLTMHVARSITAAMAPGDEIVVSGLDHEANVGPWRSAAADRGITVHTVDIRPDDVTLDVEAFDRLLHGRPKLVAFGWASNAFGTINPVAELVRRAHEAGALTYVDAVHAAPHLPIDVQAVGTDFLACSAYKFFGPHVGRALRAPGGPRRAADATSCGRRTTGSRPARSTSRGSPAPRAAVEYIAEVGRAYGAPFAGRFAGMAAGRRRDAHAGMAAIRAYEMGLFGRLLDGLEAIPGVRVWGITDRARLEERTPTAADHLRPDHARGGRDHARRAGHRHLVGRLLRDWPGGAARPPARGRPADRPHALQHGGRGGPAARRAADDRGRLTRASPGHPAYAGSIRYTVPFRSHTYSAPAQSCPNPPISRPEPAPNRVTGAVFGAAVLETANTSPEQ